MDLGALIVVVGTGALVDALADIQLGKDVVVTLLAAGMLLLALSIVGRATGEYGIVTAIAFLYLLASVFKNYKNVPIITELAGAKSTPVTNTPAANISAGSPTSFSSSPAAGRLGISA